MFVECSSTFSVFCGSCPNLLKTCCWHQMQNMLIFTKINEVDQVNITYITFVVFSMGSVLERTHTWSHSTLFVYTASLESHKPQPVRAVRFSGVQPAVHLMFDVRDRLKTRCSHWSSLALSFCWWGIFSSQRWSHESRLISVPIQLCADIKPPQTKQAGFLLCLCWICLLKWTSVLYFTPTSAPDPPWLYGTAFIFRNAWWWQTCERWGSSVIPAHLFCTTVCFSHVKSCRILQGKGCDCVQNCELSLSFLIQSHIIHTYLNFHVDKFLSAVTNEHGSIMSLLMWRFSV